jgi:peptidoglycan hydrolase CwlO-like protein
MRRAKEQKMALTEKQYINKIEFLHTGDVQVRESTEVFRDDQMIAQEYHRRVVSADEQLDGPLAERLQGIQLEVVAERNSLREEKAQLETQKADLEKQLSDKDAELQKANEDHQKTIENYDLLVEAKKLVEDELALAKQELESLKPIEDAQEEVQAEEQEVQEEQEVSQ